MGERISPESATAMARLFQAESAGLARYACTLPGVGSCDAEDLVQVTFQEALTCWEHLLCRLNGESQRRWLYRVLKNKEIDRWRAVGARQVPSAHLDRMPEARHDPYLHSVRAIILQRCWDAIGKMPEVRQKVAFLRWSEEWTSAEIADWLAITQSTVRGHLKVARDELVQEVGPDLALGDLDNDAGEEEVEEEW